MKETIFQQIGFVVVIAIVATFYIPVSYMRQRMKRMSEADLLKNNPEEWIKQVKSNAYTQLVCRGLLGLFFIGFIFFNYKLIAENGIDYSVVLFFVTGLAFIFFAVSGYKAELKRLGSIDKNL